MELNIVPLHLLHKDIRFTNILISVLENYNGEDYFKEDYFLSNSWNSETSAPPASFPEFSKLLKHFKMNDISHLDYIELFDLCVKTEYSEGFLTYVFKLEDFLIGLIQIGKFSNILELSDFNSNFLTKW